MTVFIFFIFFVPIFFLFSLVPIFSIFLSAPCARSARWGRCARKGCWSVPTRQRWVVAQGWSVPCGRGGTGRGGVGRRGMGEVRREADGLREAKARKQRTAGEPQRHEGTKRRVRRLRRLGILRQAQDRPAPPRRGERPAGVGTPALRTTDRLKTCPTKNGDGRRA